MKKISGFIGRHAVVLSVLLLIGGVWPLLQLPKVKLDNAIDVWLDHQSPEYREYVRFKQDYGNDEWIMVSFSLNRIPADRIEAQVGAIASRLRKIDDAIQVISLADADPVTLQALGGLLISADKKTAGILLNLSGLGIIENRRTIVRKIDEALALHSNGLEFHLGGPTLLNAELDRISENQSRKFMSLAFAIAVISLYAVFRSAIYTLIALTGVVPAVIFSLGTAVGAGMTFNMITTVLPVLIWVLSLTGAIHLIHRFRMALRSGMRPEAAVARAVDQVFKPYAVAVATTVIGFLSLLLSHMGPVRDLGLWAAAGITIGFICNMILIPAILILASRKRLLINSMHSLPFGMGLPPAIIRRHKWPIVTAGVLLLAGPLFLIPCLRVESNVMTFFKKNSRIQRDYEFISRNLTGLSTMELDFQGPFSDAHAYIEKLGRRLQDTPDLRPVVFMSAGVWRMSIFVKNMESMGFNRLVEKVRQAMAEIEPGGVKVRLTGTVLLLNAIQEELVRTQVKSFAMALLSIMVILALVFKSAAIVGIGTAVNVFPITVLVGAAALSGIPLNVATIMIAAVAVGIAVDDTVFFLTRLHSEAGHASGAEGAIDATLIHMAGPITCTTLVVSIGFFVLIPADFTPIRHFGMLGGLTMISAWIGDIVLLPALLYAFHRPTKGTPCEPR